MLAHLDRKLLRDLRRMKGQAAAVSLVMACGLAMLIMSRSLIHSLESTRAEYYQAHRFADVLDDLDHRHCVECSRRKLEFLRAPEQALESALLDIRHCAFVEFGAVEMSSRRPSAPKCFEQQAVASADIQQSHIGGRLAESGNDRINFLPIPCETGLEHHRISLLG